MESGCGYMNKECWTKISVTRKKEILESEDAANGI